MKQILSKILLVAILVTSLGQAYPASAQQAVDPSFNPGMIISDKAFVDVGTFGTPEGIQMFLEQKGSVLANTSQDFLVKLKEPDTLTKVGLEDPRPNLTRLRTAAELIYDAGTKFGLNPQVLLVTLQKEQSLISGNFSDASLQRGLDRALGFGCPDYEGCGEIFLSFYRQLFGSFDNEGNRWLGASASLMKSYNTMVGGVRVGRGPGVDASGNTFGRPIVRISRVGDTITLDNTMGGYAGITQQQTVTIANSATAALYRYTPHVFNGNYNFWKFYSAWFKYPNGTIIQKVGDTQQYVIDNSTKRPFSSFVATQRKLNTANVIMVSQVEFDSYPTEKPMPPLDGTLIKGDTDATIYLIEDSSKHPISYPVFIQRKFSFANVVTAPSVEVATYAQGSYVAPLTGTLIMSDIDPTVYMMDEGVKRPISGSIFAARKLSFGAIMKLSNEEVASISSGSFLTPPEQTGFKSETSAQVWWMRDNLKHSVSAFVFEQRGVGTFPFYVLSEGEIMNIPTGNPLTPRDGTVIKGDVTDGIFLMEGGLKKLLTPESYKRLRYPKATILPQAEVDQYQPGDDILK